MEERFKFSKLELPIILAPMAGINTSKQVALVSNMGGMGSFGFAYSSPDQIRSELRKAKNLTSGPINTNFFIFKEVELPSSEVCDQALSVLLSLPGAKNLDLTLPKPPYFQELSAQLEPVWQEKPEVLTFHFGLPEEAIILKAHSLGIAVGGTATSLSEGSKIEAIGADFVIAQGIEAGGHRGIFDVKAPDDALKTLDLVRILHENIKIPIVAAGGIMNGEHIREALKAGAVAAQMGTAFLTCLESSASPAYKKSLLSKGFETEFTSAFSGRLARGLKNEFIRLMENQPVLPFPVQNTLTNTIRKAAIQREDPEYQSLWAGENYKNCRSISTVELMQQLQEELHSYI